MRGEAPCPGRRTPAPPETPPRAWGRHIAAIPFENAGGNTPTCVGKTRGSGSGRCCARKHPHVRGEDSCCSISKSRLPETPPRAWGRRINLRFCFLECRNTPTCVGKTSSSHPAGADRWKHPHVRGEDRLLLAALPPPLETPPRAWGRQSIRAPWRPSLRNTPTCVGKTSLKNCTFRMLKKHPHVRGEDLQMLYIAYPAGETPPRAWGRHSAENCQYRGGRNTPTCVGKTRRRSAAR